MERIDIKSVLEATPEQLVSLEAKVKRIDAPKVISTASGPLKKQECTVVDPTNYILWEENFDTLEENMNYVFNNMKVKESYFGKYLNTAKGTEFLYEKVEDFDIPLAQIDDVPTLTIQEINGSIVGVQQLDKHLTCIKCSKKVERKKTMPIMVCQNPKCTMQQKESMCKSQWFGKIFVKDNSNPQENQCCC